MKTYEDVVQFICAERWNELPSHDELAERWYDHWEGRHRLSPEEVDEVGFGMAVYHENEEAQTAVRYHIEWWLDFYDWDECP